MHACSQHNPTAARCGKALDRKPLAPAGRGSGWAAAPGASWASLAAALAAAALPAPPGRVESLAPRQQQRRHGSPARAQRTPCLVRRRWWRPAAPARPVRSARDDRSLPCGWGIGGRGEPRQNRGAQGCDARTRLHSVRAMPMALPIEGSAWRADCGSTRDREGPRAAQSAAHRPAVAITVAGGRHQVPANHAVIMSNAMLPNIAGAADGPMAHTPWSRRRTQSHALTG